MWRENPKKEKSKKEQNRHDPSKHNYCLFVLNSHAHMDMYSHSHK